LASATIPNARFGVLSAWADRRVHRLLWLAALWASQAAADDMRAVVFLLGRDQPGERVFFAPAESYHRAQGTHVITSASSLAEVREYLVRHRGESAWERITLVVHGTPWTGLDLPVFGGGPGADLSLLEESRASGEFPPMPGGVIDTRTQLIVEACGIGRRLDLLEALARLLSSADGSIMQSSSPEGFVAYMTGEDSPPRRFELAFATAIVPRRNGGMAAKALEAASKRLRAALPLSGSGFVEDIHPIAIQFEWPAGDVPPRGQLRRALSSDAALQRRLRSHGLRLSDLEWSMRATGSPTPALRIMGRADLLVVRAALPVE